MTCLGFWDVAVLSRYVSGLSRMVRCRMGKSFLISGTFRRIFAACAMDSTSRCDPAYLNPRVDSFKSHHVGPPLQGRLERVPGQAGALHPERELAHALEDRELPERLGVHGRARLP